MHSNVALLAAILALIFPFSYAVNKTELDDPEFTNSTSTNETFPQLIRFLQDFKDSPSYGYLTKYPNNVLVRQLTEEELSNGGTQISGMDDDEIADALTQGANVSPFCPRGINPKPTICQSCRKNYDDCDEEKVCCPFPVLKIAISFRQRCPPRLTTGCLVTKTRELPLAATRFLHIIEQPARAHSVKICVCLRRKYCCIEPSPDPEPGPEPDDWRTVHEDDTE